jgi:hypothetical protein
MTSRRVIDRRLMEENQARGYLLYIIHRAVQLVIPGSPGAYEVIAAQVLGLFPKAEAP